MMAIACVYLFACLSPHGLGMWQDPPMRGARAAALLLIGMLCLAACTSPAQRADRFALRSGFTKAYVDGGGFRLLVYRNSAAAAGVHETLRVYIEGDGTPYLHRNSIARDPTPHDPLMLRLMALDPAASIYLGRPCYFGLGRDAGCGPELWTQRRFGPEVIASMEAAMRREQTRAGARRLELAGHSGGGTLAVLLAQRIDAVDAVVTIGANLDLAAWCRLHGYSPLTGSLSPVDLAPRAGVKVLHLVGADDGNTPPEMIAAAARARGEPVRVFAHQDHNCCWESRWPDILSELP
jgi:hypothetical protein